MAWRARGTASSVEVAGLDVGWHNVSREWPVPAAGIGNAPLTMLAPHVAAETGLGARRGSVGGPPPVAGKSVADGRWQMADGRWQWFACREMCGEGSGGQVGTYAFKFIVDGRWTTSPDLLLTAPDSSGMVNNYIEVRCTRSAVTAARHP